MRSVVSLLVVALIAVFAYKFWFSQMQSSGAGANPTQVIDIVGVKNDLISIAQAERAYQAEHGSYASLQDLTSSGALTMTRSGRDGFTYEVETSGAGFRVVAHCPAATSPGCQDWYVDETMQVAPVH
jgi:hypothetical protein